MWPRRQMPQKTLRASDPIVGEGHNHPFAYELQKSTNPTCFGKKLFPSENVTWKIRTGLFTPSRKLRPCGSSPLDCILNMIVTNIADPFVAPAPTDFTVLLADCAHPKIFGPANDYDGRVRFRRHRQDIIYRMWFIV